MHVQPYLYFSGRTEEALAFYGTALGAERGMLLRFNDSPEPHPEGMIPAGWGDKVMHCSFKVGETEILASDGCSEAGARSGFALALSVKDAEEAAARFAALSEGGQVMMPLGKTFFSPAFGMVTDRFGVAWSVVAAAEGVARAAA
ncbi:VOC family protein [Chelatococcus sambhunathii]|uniref:VOC family protein n=1 Tax=Chelatococcus sambhunathii TaxID=363953 RepID=A0ABU1DFB8_9HYPH|nr:VOC family protein [Chelatococcus sambhunathii]MDR4306821.1 VOC family protein [Chelatococcus sambhunathii]